MENEKLEEAKEELLHNEVEKEAIEKLDDTGYFPTFKYEEERNHEKNTLQYRHSTPRLKKKQKLSMPNSFYAILETRLQEIADILQKTSSAVSSETKIWLEPASEAYRLTIISPRPSSAEITKIIPLLREAGKKEHSRLTLIRPIDSFVENPDNRQTTTLNNEPIALIPLHFYINMLAKMSVEEVAEITLQSNQLESLEQIIWFIEDAGLARIKSILSTRIMNEPVGATITLEYNNKISKQEIITISKYIAEIMKKYIEKNYNVQTDYKITKTTTEKTEIFLYRPDKIKI